MVEVLLHRSAGKDCIVKVNEGKMLFYARKDHVDRTLKSAWFDVEPEWDRYKAIGSMMGCEYRFICVCIVCFDLPASAVNVKR